MNTATERAQIEPDVSSNDRREYLREWKRKKLESDPEYFRREAKKFRALHPEKKRAINARYRERVGVPAYRAMMRDAQIRARESNREAYRARMKEMNARRREERKEYNKLVAGTPAVIARQTLARAVKSGRVVKPKACSACLADTPSRRLHGHHEDYSRPLDVKWLCSICHGKTHRMAA